MWPEAWLTSCPSRRENSVACCADAALLAAVSEHTAGRSNGASVSGCILRTSTAVDFEWNLDIPREIFEETINRQLCC